MKKNWDMRLVAIDRAIAASKEPEPEPEPVIVLFRKDRFGSDKQITAVFPEIEDSPGFMTCYAHVGQHGSASLGWMLDKTRPATEAEYVLLARELRAIGYKLIIRKRRPARCRLG